jgi:hypothetical protein
MPGPGPLNYSNPEGVGETIINRSDPGGNNSSDRNRRLESQNIRNRIINSKDHLSVRAGQARSPAADPAGFFQTISRILCKIVRMFFSRYSLWVNGLTGCLPIVTTPTLVELASRMHPQVK